MIICWLSREQPARSRDQKLKIQKLSPKANSRNQAMTKTLEWTDEGVVMIDQRKLPGEELYPVFRTYEEVAGAIEDMVVRGAPAIGVAAAMGIALGVKDSLAAKVSDLDLEFETIC